MNNILNCEQFIEGKLLGSLSYTIVAHTPNLSNQNDFFKQAFNYRFWGLQQPNYDNCKAAGYLYSQDYIILIQVAPAIDDQGQYLFDNKGRLFNQHRYVLIPQEALNYLQDQTFPLLGWIFDQPIPIFTEFNPNLSALNIALLSTDQTDSIEVKNKNISKLKKCLLICNLEAKEKPYLLLAISALINNYRILLTLEQENSPDDFLESILLLLPASIRSQMSIAVGTIDEQYCDWAKILIKTNNNNLEGKLPSNLLWLKRDNPKIMGNFDPEIFNSYYVDYFLSYLINDSQNLATVLDQLNHLQDHNLTLESLNKIETIIKFIPLLPETKQKKVWAECFAQFTLETWTNNLDFIKDDLSVNYAWQTLINQFQETNNFAEQNFDIFFKIWQKFPPPRQIELLNDLLNNHLSLTKQFLNYILTEIKDLENFDHEILSKLRSICQQLIKKLSQENMIEAWQFANKISHSYLFTEPREKFLLLDQVLTVELTTKQLLTFFNIKFIPLLFNLTAELITNSYLYYRLKKNSEEVTQLLSNLFILNQLEDINIIESIFKLSNLTQMQPLQKDDFYSLALQNNLITEENYQKFLVKLLQYHYYAQDYPQTYQVLQSKIQDDQLLNLLNQGIKDNQQNWDFWHKLALLIDPDEKEDYLLFLDHNLSDNFPLILLEKMLNYVNNYPEKLSLMLTSKTWQNINQEDLSKLVHKLPQLAIIITYVLKEDYKLDWFNRDLLHYVIEICLNHKLIAKELRELITSPTIIKQFTHEDWLKLNRLSWFPETQFPLPLDRPLLKEFEQKIIMIDAQNMIKTYTKLEETQFLINNCQIWQLTKQQQAEILTKVKPQACNINLISPYFYDENNQLIQGDMAKKLWKILIKIPLLNEQEQENLGEIMSKIMLKQILPNQDLNLLKYWKENTINLDLYNQAFMLANQIYIKQISLDQLFNYVQLLQQYSLWKECEVILTLAFSPHLPQNIISQINHYLQ